VKHPSDMKRWTDLPPGDSGDAQRGAAFRAAAAAVSPDEASLARLKGAMPAPDHSRPPRWSLALAGVLLLAMGSAVGAAGVQWAARRLAPADDLVTVDAGQTVHWQRRGRRLAITGPTTARISGEAEATLVITGGAVSVEPATEAFTVEAPELLVKIPAGSGVEVDLRAASGPRVLAHWGEVSVKAAGAWFKVPTGQTWPPAPSEAIAPSADPAAAGAADPPSPEPAAAPAVAARAAGARPVARKLQAASPATPPGPAELAPPEEPAAPPPQAPIPPPQALEPPPQPPAPPAQALEPPPLPPAPLPQAVAPPPQPALPLPQAPPPRPPPVPKPARPLAPATPRQVFVPATPRESQIIAEAFRLLRHERRPQAALDLLDSSADPRGLVREAAIARVEALLALDRRVDALAVLKTMPISATGVDRRLLVGRGELHAETGDCSTAVADFTAVINSQQRDGFDERALQGRAACRQRLGQTSAARADLNLYLARYPNGRFAAQSRARVGP
jgi:hypothetical protein